jgi:hypothetical protein
MQNFSLLILEINFMSPFCGVSPLHTLSNLFLFHMEKPLSANIKMPMPTAMPIMIVPALLPSPENNKLVSSSLCFNLDKFHNLMSRVFVALT